MHGLALASSAPPERAAASDPVVDPGDAVAWVRRQLAWERRLDRLRAANGGLKAVRPRPEGVADPEDDPS